MVALAIFQCPKLDGIRKHPETIFLVDEQRLTCERKLQRHSSCDRFFARFFIFVVRICSTTGQKF